MEDVPPIQPPRTRQLDGACSVRGRRHRPSPRHQQDVPKLAEPQELLFNQLPLPHTTTAETPIATLPSSPPRGRRGAGTPHPGELPGAAGDAMAPRRGRLSPSGWGAAEPRALGGHLVRVEGGLPAPQLLSWRRLQICSRTWVKLWSLGVREAREP